MKAQSVRYADRMGRVRPSAIRELLQLGADPNIVSFGDGYPDPTLFPMDDLHAIFDELLVAENALAAIHSSQRASGAAYAGRRTPRPRRDQLRRRRRLDHPGRPTGSGPVREAGDQRRGCGDHREPNLPWRPDRLQPVPTDIRRRTDGRRRDGHEPSRPDFQNPTGVTLGEGRRERLIELANSYEVLVVEDTPYRALRYDGEHLPTLKSLDTQGRVVHLGSFSKILAPGMRLGWAVANEEILPRLGLLKLAADTQSSTLNMAATSAYLARYDLEAHIAEALPGYRHKRDLMLQTMAASFPSSVSFTRADGGLFTWLTFPVGFDAAEFMRRDLLPKARVAFVPGATFFPVVEEPNHARLSFSGVPDEQLVGGTAALGELLHARL